MKPHIRRYFLGKRLGWGWAVFARKHAKTPIKKTQSFRWACSSAQVIFKLRNPTNVQV